MRCSKVLTVTLLVVFLPIWSTINFQSLSCSLNCREVESESATKVLPLFETLVGVDQPELLFGLRDSWRCLSGLSSGFPGRHAHPMTDCQSGRGYKAHHPSQDDDYKEMDARCSRWTGLQILSCCESTPFLRMAWSLPSSSIIGWSYRAFQKDSIESMGLQLLLIK